MQIIFEFVFSFIIEIFPPIIAELMFEFGFESISSSVRQRRTANPFIAGIGLLIMGAISGLIISWILPRRLIPSVNLHGLSIFIAAAAAGFIMMKYGEWQERRDGNPSYLATFWGGAIFAASMALTRWGLVGR